MNKTYKITYWIVVALLAFAAVTLLLMAFNGIRWNTELGIFDSRYYWCNLGEYMETGIVHYDYTHLNLFEIYQRIFA